MEILYFLDSQYLNLQYYFERLQKAPAALVSLEFHAEAHFSKGAKDELAWLLGPSGIDAVHFFVPSSSLSAQFLGLSSVRKGLVRQSDALAALNEGFPSTTTNTPRTLHFDEHVKLF